MDDEGGFGNNQNNPAGTETSFRQAPVESNSLSTAGDSLYKEPISSEVRGPVVKSIDNKSLTTRDILVFAVVVILAGTYLWGILETDKPTNGTAVKTQSTTTDKNNLKTTDTITAKVSPKVQKIIDDGKARFQESCMNIKEPKLKDQCVVYTVLKFGNSGECETLSGDIKEDCLKIASEMAVCVSKWNVDVFKNCKSRVNKKIAASMPESKQYALFAVAIAKDDAGRDSGYNTVSRLYSDKTLCKNIKDAVKRSNCENN